jgi:hypothetical protein
MSRRRIACRYRLEPAAWCKPCREGMPEKCIDPGVTDERRWTADRLNSELEAIGSDDQVPFHDSALVPFGVGCAMAGAGLATILHGGVWFGWLVILAGLFCIAAALRNSEKD